MTNDLMNITPEELTVLIDDDGIVVETIVGFDTDRDCAWISFIDEDSGEWEAMFLGDELKTFYRAMPY